MNEELPLQPRVVFHPMDPIQISVESSAWVVLVIERQYGDIQLSLNRDAALRLSECIRQHAELIPE